MSFFSLKNTDYKDSKRGIAIINFLKNKINLKKSNILEIGCGPGAISLSFAENSKFFCSGDISRKNLKITKKRIKDRKISNSYFVNMNAISLPFKDNSFDFVIINGVLEWVPCGNTMKPENAQIRALKEARRILKKDGLIYLGIENRFFIGYFLGKRDHHSGLRFATFLPRRIANFYSKIITGKPYRTYLYGKAGYKSLFKEVGFHDVESYAALPTYPFPKKIIMMSDKKEIRKAADEVFEDKGFRIGMKIIASLGLYHTFGYGFVILAKKMKN